MRHTMTFAAFMAESQRRQRLYIATEQHRMNVLDCMRVRLMPEPTARGSEPLAYKLAAGAIGLHAMQGDGIVERLLELDGMAARVGETHGDTPGMRAAWQLRYGPVMDLQAA